MLLLTAPAQHIADNPAVECDPKRVKHWLASLPVNDAQATVNQLIMALKPLNEFQMDVVARLKLLETYHASFETILCTFDDLHMRTLDLNHEQRRKLSEDVMWVYLELANGYKSIIKAAYEGGDTDAGQDVLLLSIYRAIELIANALIYAFRDHETPPPLAYLELHQLYYLAEQYRLESKAISSIKRQAHNPTIQHLYKKIMLLINGGAYTYDGGQINELYELLEQYAADCELTQQADTVERLGCYFLDFTEDAVPTSCLKMSVDVLLPTQRILNITQAIQHINADLINSKGTAPDTIRGGELRLLRLFITNLQKGYALREQRQHRQDVARIAYGMEAVCYYLGHRDRFVEDGVESMHGIEVRDIDMFEAEHELLNWHVTNATPNGRMLIAEAHEGIYLRTGEVVSIVEQFVAQQEPLILTGLIRWLRHEDGKALMGFEILDGLPIVVTCRPLLTEADEAQDFQALYFPSNKATKKGASLLFEFSQFRQAHYFQVTVAGKVYRVEPVKIFNESPLHIQFGFRIIS